MFSFYLIVKGFDMRSGLSKNAIHIYIYTYIYINIYICIYVYRLYVYMITEDAFLLYLFFSMISIFKPLEYRDIQWP